VLLDADLAKLYGVETKVLLQALKRNPDRFPNDFMFQLTNQEFKDLRSQFVTSSWGGRRYAPYVFTEQGVAMLSSVLNSPRAIAVNDHARLRAAARHDCQRQGIGQPHGPARAVLLRAGLDPVQIEAVVLFGEEAGLPVVAPAG
jgi:hypothetical protein